VRAFAFVSTKNVRFAKNALLRLSMVVDSTGLRYLGQRNFLVGIPSLQTDFVMAVLLSIIPLRAGPFTEKILVCGSRLRLSIDSRQLNII
jgi:hypothetical protein